MNLFYRVKCYYEVCNNNKNKQCPLLPQRQLLSTVLTVSSGIYLCR